jgi:riboflavin synthase
MFTGLIQSMGSIVLIESRGGDSRIVIKAPGLPLADISLGDSIAVNGACLTAIEIDEHGFAADVSQETLSLTTLGALTPGAPVNLEPSLTLASPLGGHLVSGHIDATGSLASIHPDARSTRMDFEVPGDLMRYMARKGSVSIDGTSLTINDISDVTISVNIVPHTLEKTIMGTYEKGAKVNLEVDLIARYLERLLAGQA